MLNLKKIILTSAFFLLASSSYAHCTMTVYHTNLGGNFNPVTTPFSDWRFNTCSKSAAGKVSLDSGKTWKSYSFVFNYKSAAGTPIPGVMRLDGGSHIVFKFK